MLRTYLRVKPISGWICGSTMMGHTVTRKKSRQTAQPEKKTGHSAVWLMDSVATDASVPF